MSPHPWREIPPVGAGGGEKGRGEESVKISLTDNHQRVFENIEVSSRKDGVFNRWKSDGIRLFI